ncbi:hypothetical protein Bca4012_015493 [Brassica carinata]
MRNRETNLKVRDPEIEEEIHGLAKASDPREIWISGKQTLAADSDEIQMQFLRPHNTLRAKLRLPPLRWSNKLARYATRWARTRRGDCNLIHSGGPYGENLFWGSGKGWTPGNAVVAWASERRFYDRKTYRCKANGDCLHYTQLVWKKSLRIGCAIVFCKSGDTFVICNYDPPGNIVGQPPF